jgi:hypothetical protein
VVEDTPVSFDELAKQGIPLQVLDILRLLTHNSAEGYMDYIHRIAGSANQTAIEIKLADLRHNSDISRLDEADGKAYERIEKYKKAIEVLGSAPSKNQALKPRSLAEERLL